MMKTWRMIEKGIDAMLWCMEKFGWVLILYCMFLGVTDVFLRYVMNSPSLWISVTVQAAMVLMACVGGLYALDKGAFVKLDLFYANFSPKKKAVCDIITSVYTFFFLWAVAKYGYTKAMMSYKFNEVTPTAVPIPIYPLKIFIVITAWLVLIVVVKKIINDFIVIFGGDKTKEKELFDGYRKEED